MIWNARLGGRAYEQDFPETVSKALYGYSDRSGGSPLDEYLPRCKHLPAARAKPELESSGRVLRERSGG
jgi:hypothetical protein